MKKVLLILLVLMVYVPAFAINTSSSNQLKPEWSDFSAYGYENAKFDDSFYFLFYNRIYRDKNNYWAQRKYDFEKMVSECDKKTSENRDACYIKVTQRQERINAEYNKPLNLFFNGLHSVVSPKPSKTSVDE